MVFYNNIPYTTFQLSTAGAVTLRKFETGTWNNVIESGFSDGNAYTPTIRLYGNTAYISYKDVANSGGASVMVFELP